MKVTAVTLLFLPWLLDWLTTNRIDHIFCLPKVLTTNVAVISIFR
jgi:hypothetical protein